MRLIPIISALFIVNISFFACTEDPLEMEVITSNLQVEGLEAIRQGDSIRITFDIPENEYLKGYKIVDEISSFELVVEDMMVNEYYIPTYPGAHEISVYLIDLEGNLSMESKTSIHITDVYILGSLTGTNIRYWKNGVGVEVDGGSRGIFVEGNDVYTVGYENDLNTGNSVARYWKNGIPVTLSDGSKREQAYSICVENDNIYVLGQETDPVTFNYAIKYWTNGAETKLTDGSTDAATYINALAVENGIVYAIGVVEDPVTGNDLLKYWVNGEEIVLTDIHENFRRGFIAVENGNIYVAGYFNVYDETLNQDVHSIKCWINGKVQALFSEPQVDINTQGISVKDGNFCIPTHSEDLISGNETYSYYMNGIDQGELAKGDLHWRIASCASNSGDFYICGEDRNLSTGDILCYWVNGEKVQLTDGTLSANALNIFVAD